MTALNELAGRLMAAGSISSEDVLALRRQVWPDGTIEGHEAEMVFAINDAAKDAAPEWVEFFVEALTEHIVRQQEPRGYVDEATAHWLIERIGRDGRVETHAELELMVKILETAAGAPERLKCFVLAEIERIVLSGAGPTRNGTLKPGTVDEAEVKLLRRLIFAAAGDGPACVSEAEAELLFRIKDATLNAENAPGWQQLFVQGVGNHLMAYQSYRPLQSEEAARLEAFMDDRAVRLGGFLSRVGAAMTSPGAPRAFGHKAPDHGAAAETARAVTSAESNWLRSRIDADGARDPLEEALLEFLAEESGAAPLG